MKKNITLSNKKLEEKINNLFFKEKECLTDEEVEKELERGEKIVKFLQKDLEELKNDYYNNPTPVEVKRTYSNIDTKNLPKAVPAFNINKKSSFLKDYINFNRKNGEIIISDDKFYSYLEIINNKKWNNLDFLDFLFYKYKNKEKENINILEKNKNNIIIMITNAKTDKI